MIGFTIRAGNVNALIFLILDGAAVGTLFLFVYLVIYVIARHARAIRGCCARGNRGAGAGDGAGCGKTSRPVL